MWTLFVISVVIGNPEVKVTRYADYETEWTCNIALDALDKEFTEGEKAICMKTGRATPTLNSLY